MLLTRTRATDLSGEVVQFLPKQAELVCPAGRRDSIQTEPVGSVVRYARFQSLLEKWGIQNDRVRLASPRIPGRRNGRCDLFQGRNDVVARSGKVRRL